MNILLYSKWASNFETNNITMNSLRTEIKDILSDASTHITTNDIRSKLENKTTKKEINRELYSLLKTGSVVRIDGTPPKWGINYVKPGESDNDHMKLYVDLGNVHDCLKPLCHYDYPVKAFADSEFNGFGVNPVPDKAHIRVTKATSKHKNAADLELMWELFTDSVNEKMPTTYVVVTKDKGLFPLADIVPRKNPNVTLEIVSGWDELKFYVE